MRTWLTKGRDSFIETALALNVDMRLQLARRLNSVNARAQQQNLARALQIDFAAITPESNQRDKKLKDERELRNIDYLYRQVRPGEVVSAKEIPFVDEAHSANEISSMQPPVQETVSGPPLEDTQELIGNLLEGEKVLDWVTSASSLVKYLERVVDLSREIPPFHQQILEETRLSLIDFIVLSK